MPKRDLQINVPVTDEDEYREGAEDPEEDEEDDEEEYEEYDEESENNANFNGLPLEAQRSRKQLQPPDAHEEDPHDEDDHQDIS